MPQISLTDLVDIVSKSGTPKASKVAQVKVRPDYEPAFDFYKSLREKIIDLHRKGQDKRGLTAFLGSVLDPRKKTNYPEVVEGYKKWWGRKKIAWFEPPRAVYAQSGVEIFVNPELGLEIDGVPRLIKLYFKDDPLSKLRIDLITVLMELALRGECKNKEIMSVLDVRSAKLFQLSAPVAKTKAVVDAELAYIATLWPNA